MNARRRHVLRRVASATATAGVLGLAGCLQLDALSGDDEQTPTALVAGSLLALATDVPGATVEAHGSLTVRQLILDEARDPDVVALADPELFAGLTDQVTLFATNELTVAYHPDSEFADSLQKDWLATLQHSKVRIGRTNPETDPLGYRTVLALKLAAKRGLIDQPASILGHTSLFPETQLMQVLDQGKLDAAFVYRNMAVEHELPTVNLPAEIDFSDPAHAETYASVSIELDNRTVRGAPIRYAAVARSERGQPWFENLIEGRDRLTSHGFSVPDGYPTRTGIDE